MITTSTQQTTKGMKMTRIGNRAAAKHLYQVEVEGGRDIEVDANTSTQAAAIARDACYVVRSVNMVG